MSSSSIAIGIDLGTTTSCVSILRCDPDNPGTDPIVINNLNGKSTTPSFVYFSKDSDERLFGDDAKRAASDNPYNAVYDNKRLIGRMFDDAIVQMDMKAWPFKVVEDPKTKRPLIEVSIKGDVKHFTPQQMSAQILSYLKDCAEQYIGHSVSKAVITVPAYFGDSQRQCTKEAGEIAGLEVIGMINEPTAAALAFGIGKTKQQTALIFDLGGGTFDVTVLQIESGETQLFQVVATAGDGHLGGQDFDQKLLEHCMAAFKEEYAGLGLDLKECPSGMSRLRLECEQAKMALSTPSRTKYEIRLDALMDNKPFRLVVTKDEFESMCMPLFERCKGPMVQVLKDAKLRPSDIDEVVMIGGSIRIPLVQRMVSEFFGGKKLCLSINPDEAVAKGAAIHAAKLANPHSAGLSKKINRIVFVDVIPLSLGVRVNEDEMHVLIPRNTTLPAHEAKVFSTYEDNQRAVDIELFEGEAKMVSGCRALGSFELTDIPLMKAGKPRIKVTVSVTQTFGIVELEAQELSTGVAKKVTIAAKDRLSREEIDRLVKEAEEAKELQEEYEERKDAEQRLRKYINTELRRTSTSSSSSSSSGGEALFKEALELLEAHPLISTTTKQYRDHLDELKQRHRELLETKEPIIPSSCSLSSLAVSGHHKTSSSSASSSSSSSSLSSSSSSSKKPPTTSSDEDTPSMNSKRRREATSKAITLADDEEDPTVGKRGKIAVGPSF